MKHKILCIFQVDEAVKSYIDNYFSNAIEFIFEDNPEQILIHAEDATVMIGRRPKLEYLEATTNLQLYIFPGTGVDGLLSVMEKYSRMDEITIVNTHRSAYNCAQHAMAMLLALSNQLMIHDKRMRKSERGREPTTTLLRDKTVGLLGYGAINQYVHNFLTGFESRIMILKQKADCEDVPCYSPDQLHEFLEQVDFLVLGLPLTGKTRGMIGRQELEVLGKEGFLVNVSRGAIVDQEALYESLKEGIIAGAGLDTWYHTGEGYGYDSQFPFHKLDNVILSPHRANSGTRDIPTRWDPVLSHIQSFLLGEEMVNVIDPEKGY